MFDPMDDSKDKSMKDALLQALIEKMEDVMAGGLKGRKGIGVEVQADDPAHLQDGLDKAKEVIGGSPMMKAEDSLKEDMPTSAAAAPEQDEESDEERLRALMGDDEEDEEDKK